VTDQQGERKLVISLPQKQYEQIRVNNGFGRVEAAGLQADELEVSIEAGSIELHDVSAELVLSTNAGNIAASGIVLNKPVTAKTDVGSIDIQLAEQPIAAVIKLKSEVSKVIADMPGIDFTTNTRSDKHGNIGSDGQLLKATTNVGDVTVEVKG
jgi:DUF4097 and DUF4098 domain-containing protein YvlB